jgi:hypothetical protein
MIVKDFSGAPLFYVSQIFASYSKFNRTHWIFPTFETAFVQPVGDAAGDISGPVDKHPEMIYFQTLLTM